jgi:MSHA biogenesis protein MshO
MRGGMQIPRRGAIYRARSNMQRTDGRDESRPYNRVMAKGRSMLRPYDGFTLIELVIAISLTGIVISFIAMFIIAPVRAYNAQAKRAELVDAADSVLRLMARDIRSALPNSVRVRQNGSVWAIEMLNAVDGVRYRETGSGTNANLELNFASPDASFSTLSSFDSSIPRGALPGYSLSIYNVGVPGADAYSLSNVITNPNTTTVTITAGPSVEQDTITLSAPFQFAYRSPNKRVFLVSGPVTYLCDESANTMRRYAGYSVANDHPDRDSASELNSAGASSSLVASRVDRCRFDYEAGTATRAGLVTLRVTFSYGSEGRTESIWLLHQVHVENAP